MCSLQNTCSLLATQQLFLQTENKNLRDVQKSVFVLVLVVDTAHQSRRGGKHLIDKDENGLLWRQLDALANNIYELADCKICRNQILLLVDGGDVGLFDLFADNLLETAVSDNVTSCKLPMNSSRVLSVETS